LNWSKDVLQHVTPLAAVQSPPSLTATELAGQHCVLNELAFHLLSHSHLYRVLPTQQVPPIEQLALGAGFPVQVLSGEGGGEVQPPLPPLDVEPPMPPVPPEDVVPAAPPLDVVPPVPPLDVVPPVPPLDVVPPVPPLDVVPAAPPVAVIPLEPPPEVVPPVETPPEPAAPPVAGCSLVLEQAPSAAITASETNTEAHRRALIVVS